MAQVEEGWLMKERKPRPTGCCKETRGNVDVDADGENNVEGVEETTKKPETNRGWEICNTKEGDLNHKKVGLRKILGMLDILLMNSLPCPSGS